MNYLPMNSLGALEISPKVVRFGIYLPGVDSAKGYAVSVKIIHETDQYLQAAQPALVTQAHSVDPTYGDYWSGQIDLNTAPPPPGSSVFGQPGRYVYRYLIHSPTRGDIDFIIDPFSREVGVGRLSAITVESAPYAFSANETTWKTPPLKNAIIYELMITEFRDDLGRTIRQLPYLADLGINCIEVMPVSNVLSTIDWGYDPIGYFCVAERFGKASDFQQFVDLCHQNGIAVIVDSVYGHTGGDFAYTQLYGALQGDLPNPFNGGSGEFGTLNDFTKKLTQDHYYSVNQFWLDTFHVDGFRFDDVPEYWDGPTGAGYANLVFTTFQYVKAKAGATDHYQRFFDAAGNINLIQIAEYLPDPPDILYGSYSTGTWQDGTLGAAASCAAGTPGAIEQLGLQLGLNGYPTSVTVNGDALPKTALQYIENHDHQRFICNFGTIGVDNDPDDVLLQQGDRDDNWPKVQPYLIALMTAKGTPLLSEGQEFCENYWIPANGYGRVMLYRPVRWNYFYDNDGKPIIRLLRKLTKIRRSGTQFSDGQHFFYNDYNNFNSKGLLAFSRQVGNTFSLVVVNFTNQEQTTSFASFPTSGNYVEEIEGGQNLNGVVAGAAQTISVPSNYGCIWTTA
ncbi:MAG TPA: alpha-amylase family glycosyl hydrolase [Candidatus Acidoferrales bacterium]|jgi:maltooligosyltrehalose trehalohydrolase|nr:alpha-amylase family glycosyl hydrolase [Candidatus Acidoferrales bacterium]